MALWIFSVTAHLSQYQKGKANLDLLEKEIVSGSGIIWAIWKSAPHPRQIITPASPTQFLQARCPSCHPTNSVKALKDISTEGHCIAVSATSCVISGERRWCATFDTSRCCCGNYFSSVVCRYWCQAWSATTRTSGNSHLLTCSVVWLCAGNITTP